MFREALIAADQCHNIHLDTSSSNSWSFSIGCPPGKPSMVLCCSYPLGSDGREGIVVGGLRLTYLEVPNRTFSGCSTGLKNSV